MSTTEQDTRAVNGDSKGVGDSDHGPGPAFVLDISKLHSLPSEQQDLYLFNFTSNLESHLTSLSQELLLGQQVYLKRELLKIIGLQSPAPSRIIRRSLGRTFATLFIRGDRKLLFDSINELVTIISSGRGDREPKNRNAAVHVLGEIYNAAGDGATSLSSLVCSTLTRSIKAAASQVALRAAIFRALGKIVRASIGSLDESVARDIWKHAKNGASGDKAGLVQINACWCLEQLIKITTFFDNTNDFETFKTTLLRVSDSPIPAVRRGFASCLASALKKSYSESAREKSAPNLKKPKKSSKNKSLAADEREDESIRPETPTFKKSPMQLEFTLLDVFKQLSAQYVKLSTSNRTRIAIFHCYSRILRDLENQVIETEYNLIADHLLVELLTSPLIAHHRYRLLLTRRLVQKLLADIIGSRILGETGQINAAKILIYDVLKNYPQAIKDRVEPSKLTLTGALNALTSLIQRLGSAFNPMADTCREVLVQVLQHPSYTVQIHASQCLRSFTLACPQQLIQCASICMNSVSRELGLLNTGRQSARKTVGYANGLAAVLSVSPLKPLHNSLEINSRVLSLATGLLKSSINVELRTSGTQIQVAWILIGGLMSLGPNFVKIHLSQLLLLWRNALPKPLTKENAGVKQSAEISFLMHVRECALGSILTFLEFNGRLVTVDVARRIGLMLQNTIELLENMPMKKSSGETSFRLTPSLQLSDLIIMVRRRVLQCYSRLAICSPLASRDILSQSNLLTFAMAGFADLDYSPPGSLGSSIANTAGNFEGVWDLGDNYGFGVTGMIRGFELKQLPGEHNHEAGLSWHKFEDEDVDMDQLLLSSVCGAMEHDSVCVQIHCGDGLIGIPDPPATEVINSAIALFSMSLPFQPSRVQESTIEQLATIMAANSLQRDLGRKAAIRVNVTMALLATLKVAMSETLAAPGDLRHPSVGKILSEILRALIIDQDQFIRNAAYETFGRLCNIFGNSFTAQEVNNLIDIIVSNRDPDARAGCAMALGSIHSNVGGMAAGLHLRNVHGILMSLCSDPHPAVHFWAIQSLAKVADSAGLTFSGYVSSTLGLLVQLWMSDTHNAESDAIVTSNLELELPTPAALAYATDSLVNVLGPDLQDMKKVRDLILTLIRQFDLEDSVAIRALSLRCWEHVYLYAPISVDLSMYVRHLQESLDASDHKIGEVAIDGLDNLIRRDAEEVFRIAGDGLGDQIWNALGSTINEGGIRRIIEAWLGQTSLTKTAEWISQCQDILTKSLPKANRVEEQNPKTPAVTDIQDDEVAGFAVGNAKEEDKETISGGQELLRWQIRGFALRCLGDILAIVGRDLQLNSESHAGSITQQKIAEVVRIAFLASTSPIVELRVSGLKLIDQVLTIYGRTLDPDFTEALLLEQYQAQISSALTPAFSADSSPELASAAVNVCATFIATGLVTDVERMGRILKLLVSALESFANETGDAAVGDLKGLSSNAQTMVKMAVLSAWAELQVASTMNAYLVEVVKPYATKLTPLWLSSLQEFARLRFEPDISSSIGPVSASESLDTIYAAFNRQTLLGFYQESWLRLVDAIASLIDQDSNFVFDALDGKANTRKTNRGDPESSDIDYREEPVAFFFVLFGIVFEALMARPNSDSAEQTLDILRALKKIIRPSISGIAIYQDAVFSETMELLDRLALTEGLEVQGVIVQITKDLCISHPSAEGGDTGGDKLSDDIEQLFELTRIIVLVLAGVLPNLGEGISNKRYQITEEAVSLVKLSLEGLVDASEVFPSVIKTDLHACILHIFTTILGTGACQAHVVPQALPIFKRFIQSITKDAQGGLTLQDQLRGCLQRFQSILANAQRRETDASLTCAKNTLLASAILLTTGSSGLAPNEPSVTSLLNDMFDCLQDLGLAKVAASCLRSLLLTAPKTHTDQAIVRYMLPRLLRHLGDVSQQDPENTRSLISHALVSFTISLNGEELFAALCMIIPALLHRASKQGKDIYKETASRLFILASRDQGAFKGVVNNMTSDQRGFMEDIIKEGGLAGRNHAQELRERRGGEPSIALKMTFGGE